MSASNATATPTTQESYITTKQFANLLNTNPSVIKKSRQSGILFDRTSPVFYRLGERKLLYKLSTVIEWIESAPKAHVSGCEQ